MDRWIKLTMGALLIAGPLACQSNDMESADDEEIAEAPMAEEELRTVEGGGELAGWHGRADGDAPLDDVRVLTIDGGWQVDNGPAVALWKDDLTATGAYTLSASFHQASSKGHPHGTGLVFGGSDLAGAGQAYTYFMVMGDGTYLVKTRDGDDTSWVLPSGGWTEHDAVNADDENGMYTNDLAVQVGETETAFMVNGTEVFRVANSEIHTDGMYGVRVNHNLTIDFRGLKVEAGM